MKGAVDSAQPLVSLLTDFGLVDPFVAEMKVAILSICPRARIVDVSHGVAEFDIKMGAFLLAEAVRSFPPGTVHVAVVDPGVGSSRRGIVVKTKRSTYVGPDNGLLIPSATMEGIVDVFEISNRSMMRCEVSSTFHGRDVFAPVGPVLRVDISRKNADQASLITFLHPFMTRFWKVRVRLAKYFT